MFKFIKDFLIYGVASILAKIVGVILMPIYTSILTKEEYGSMAIILACKGIIDLLSNLNIHSGIARDYYEEDVNRKQLVSTGLYSIFGCSLLVLSFMLITKDIWVNVLEIPNYKTAFILAILTIPAGSLLSYFSILTRFKKKPILYSIATLLQLGTQISISIYGVVFLRAGIESVFWGVLIGEIVGIIFLYFINHSLFAFTFNPHYLKKALKYSLPTLPAIMANWIDSSVGQILIGKYISIDELGVYSIALQFVSIFSLISIALQNVWGPFLYENYKKDNFIQNVRTLYISLILLLITVSVSISILSKELILFLSNVQYLNASFYLTLLCIPSCIYLLFPIVSSGISITRDTKYIGIAYCIGSGLNLLSLLIFINKFGIITVPISLAISRIVSFNILYYVSKHKNILILPNRYIILLIISIISCYCLLFLNLNIYIRILLVITINLLIFYKVSNYIDFKYILRKKNAQ